MKDEEIESLNNQLKYKISELIEAEKLIEFKDDVSDMLVRKLID